MNKTEYRQYIASSEWQEKRKEILRGNGLEGSWCNRCLVPRWLAVIAYDQDLHIHHRSYANIGNERPEDLEILCRRCHDIETFGRSDFRPIKTAKCEVCEFEHFNVYSSLCDECFRLVSGRISAKMMCSYDNWPLWKTVLNNLFQFFFQSNVGPPRDELFLALSESFWRLGKPSMEENKEPHRV